MAQIKFSPPLSFPLSPLSSSSSLPSSLPPSLPPKQGYLPANIDRREEILQRKRQEYRNFILQYYPMRNDPLHIETFRQVSIHQGTSPLPVPHPWLESSSPCSSPMAGVLLSLFSPMAGVLLSLFSPMAGVFPLSPPRPPPPVEEVVIL